MTVKENGIVKEIGLGQEIVNALENTGIETEKTGIVHAGKEFFFLL